MREFEYTFDEGLALGLRKHHKNPRNAQALVEAHNVIVTPFGVETHYDLETVLGQSINQWPFPQLVCGSEHSYLIVRDLILQAYKFYEIESNLSLTLKVTVDDQTFGVGDGKFEYVDVGPYFLFTNGKALVRRDPQTGVLNATQARTGMPLMRSLCNFKGQMIGADVRSQWHDCGEASIVWGNVGSELFTLSSSNVAGFTRLPMGGRVFKVLRLGDAVMAYGARQLAALVPVHEPAHTFKIDEMLEVGPVSPGAIGGNVHKHWFIDQAGWLWSLDSGMKLNKLGYQEFMTQLDASKISIVLDELESRVYIGDGTKSFLLTDSGLSTVHQSVGSLGVLEGEKEAICASNLDTEVRLVGDTLDFGYRSQKTLFVAEVGIDTPHLAEFSYDFRTQKRKEFFSTQWTPLNGEGWCTQIISVNDFRPKLRITDPANTQVDYMKFRWKMTDLRSLRGVYAAPLRGQGVGQ